MTDLHPCDEIAVRSGSSALTLNAKQMASARLQAKLDEWLAQGHQINAVQGQSAKVQQFNQGHVLNEKNAVNVDFNRRPRESNSPNRAALYKRGENHRANILGFMHQSGQPVTVAEISEHMGMTPEAIQHHITFLGDRNQIKPAGKRRYARLYEVVK